MFVANVISMPKHTTDTTAETTEVWQLKLLPKDGEPTVVAGLSGAQARLALAALVTGDDVVIDYLAGERFDASLRRAA
jgi:hypothetical protein